MASSQFTSWFCFPPLPGREKQNQMVKCLTIISLVCFTAPLPGSRRKWNQLVKRFTAISAEQQSRCTCHLSVWNGWRPLKPNKPVADLRCSAVTFNLPEPANWTRQKSDETQRLREPGQVHVEFWLVNQFMLIPNYQLQFWSYTLPTAVSAVIDFTKAQACMSRCRVFVRHSLYTLHITFSS